MGDWAAAILSSRQWLEQLRLLRRNRIADGNGAARDRLGMDAAFVATEVPPPA